jgi:hypothetical protein
MGVKLIDASMAVNATVGGISLMRSRRMQA